MRIERPAPRDAAIAATLTVIAVVAAYAEAHPANPGAYFTGGERVPRTPDGELRAILDVLRHADEIADPTEPAPGLARLDALAEGVRRAGPPDPGTACAACASEPVPPARGGRPCGDPGAAGRRSGADPGRLSRPARSGG